LVLIKKFIGANYHPNHIVILIHFDILFNTINCFSICKLVLWSSLESWE